MTTVAPVDHHQSLVAVLKETGLKDDRAELIAGKFKDFFDASGEWAHKAKTLVVTEEGQLDTMKEARTGRLFLKAKRVAIEKVRKEMKENSLTEGRAVDFVAKTLTGLIEPTERYLEQQETYAARAEATRKLEHSRMIAGRKQELSIFGVFLSNEQVDNYTAAEWLKIVTEHEDTYNARVRAEQAQQKAEAERQKQLEADNRKLRQQQQDNERELEKERAEKHRIQNELDKQRLAQERQQQQAQQVERERTAAPDKAKVENLIGCIGRFHLPDFTSDAGREIGSAVETKLDAIQQYLTQQLAKL